MGVKDDGVIRRRRVAPVSGAVFTRRVASLARARSPLRVEGADARRVRRLKPSRSSHMVNRSEDTRCRPSRLGSATAGAAAAPRARRGLHAVGEGLVAQRCGDGSLRRLTQSGTRADGSRLHSRRLSRMYERSNLPSRGFAPVTLRGVGIQNRPAGCP